MKKVLKVLWVADYSTKEHKGGAQQTNAVMIKAGRKLGYQIDVALGGCKIPTTKGYDVIILNNITSWEKEDIEKLVKTGKCIRYEHDQWVAEHYPELYKKVKHNIFLSPLHKKTIERKVGYKIKNSTLIPSPIQSIFKPLGEKEPNSVAYIGHLCDMKGTPALVQYIKDNPRYKFYIAGFGAMVDDIKDLENVEFLGEVELKEVVKYYQKCEYLYHKPEWKEPFGRTVLEGYLCGCSLLVNSNVGAISWDWDFSDYDLIKKKVQSQSNFWKVIRDEI